MLILTRKPDEQIVIGEGENKISIKVLDYQGCQVRFGIEAPRNVSIHRLEIYNRIQDGKTHPKKEDVET